MSHSWNTRNSLLKQPYLALFFMSIFLNCSYVLTLFLLHELPDKSFCNEEVTVGKSYGTFFFAVQFLTLMPKSDQNSSVAFSSGPAFTGCYLNT